MPEPSAASLASGQRASPRTNGPTPHSTTPEPPAIAPRIAASLAAFERERRELFRTDPFRWVAYRDGKQLRLADTQTELYRYCLRELGLSQDDFLVRCITPEDPSDVEDSPR